MKSSTVEPQRRFDSNCIRFDSNKMVSDMNRWSLNPDPLTSRFLWHNKNKNIFFKQFFPYFKTYQENLSCLVSLLNGFKSISISSCYYLFIYIFFIELLIVDIKTLYKTIINLRTNSNFTIYGVEVTASAQIFH